MKIEMKVTDARSLDSYINNKVVPFVVCIDENVKMTKMQKSFLEKYYDKVVDKRGWVSYYCNVINAWKCREMGYTSIVFPDGKEKSIRAYNLEKSPSAGGNYVVVPYFSRQDKISSVELTKLIRLEVENVKTRLNSIPGRQAA